MPCFHAYMYIDDSAPMLGLSMNRLSEADWSMKAPRPAAMSISERIGSSHAVRYTARKASGTCATFWIEPSACLIASRTSGVHRPSFFSSSTR